MYDYVIVGAGSAGCVLANRLSARATSRVALIEAGGPDDKVEIRIPAAFSKLFKTRFDWAFETVPQGELGGRALYWPRGKVLGGSASLNAMMWIRGHRDGYDAWVEAGCPGWGYDDVLPYFHRVERRLGGNPAVPSRRVDRQVCHRVYGEAGPQYVTDLRDPNESTRAFLRACAQDGLGRLADVNLPDNEGFGPAPVTQHRGRRWSAADAYLRPARRRPNLTVLTGAHATRVLFDGRRATGVEYVDAAGARHTVTAAREVVLAAGAVGSPQLLLLSGIGDPDQLREHGIPLVVPSAEVGRNLQDHLAAGVIRSCPKPVTLVGVDRQPRQLARYLLARRGPLTSNVAEAVAFVRTDPALAAPDVELVFAPVPFLDHGLTPPAGHGVTIGVILLRPASRGSLRLASADPFAAPAIDPGYLREPRDLTTLVAGMRRAQRLFSMPALAPYAGSRLLPDGDVITDEDIASFVRDRAETLYHPVGTCRMGEDLDAVVDLELRVRGVDGLRVADASVMPVITHGHTNAPTMMIAERAAELIRPPGR